MAESFILRGETIELCQLLKAAGLFNTGGEAKAAVADGQVAVDGAVETRKRCKLTRGQRVEYSGRAIEIE